MSSGKITVRRLARGRPNLGFEFVAADGSKQSLVMVIAPGQIAEGISRLQVLQYWLSVLRTFSIRPGVFRKCKIIYSTANGGRSFIEELLGAPPTTEEIKAALAPPSPPPDPNPPAPS